MAVKKSEIYSSLWASCDELRGGMDASQYKDYILVLLFVKYVSDRYAGQPDALIEVPAGGSFADMVGLQGKPNIGERINIIISTLAEANDLKGVIDVADFNDPDKLGDGKEMVVRLSRLVAIFNKPELDFRKNRADGDDILGDAYEYLMRHFATQSGKSKGQFYTPAEVSRIMAQVVGVGAAKSAEQTIYDPTCGSGSLLLRAHDEASYDLTLYGQENDNATRALAKMNMILHGCPTADIWQGNTLANPYFKNKNGNLKTNDFVVANPPFSSKAWSTGFDPAYDHYERFPYGVPPAKNGDYAFLLHVLASMKSTGKGAIILPHGVLFRGNAEADIRKALIHQGFIKGIIGLPANLFFGTGIPACIIVLDKEHANARTGIFMIDASKGFMKDGNKNRLREQDIHKIVDTFTKQTEVNKFSRMVPRAEIEANDFNLNLPRYIDSSEPEDSHDIDAHLKGGIPERDVDGLAAYWAVAPGLRRELFGSGDRPGYIFLRVTADSIRTAIHNHPEFTALAARVDEAFSGWLSVQVKTLKGLESGCRPKALIRAISEDLLSRFASFPLIDAYDVYQHLMTYWAEVMQDDVYQISEDGWLANADLIPAPLIVARYYPDDRAAIDELETVRDAVSQDIEELAEEHGGEDGLLADAKTDKGKLTIKSVKDRLKEIKDDRDAKDEIKMLKRCLKLIEKEAAAGKAIKVAVKALATKVDAKYRTLTQAEVKVLVVDDKWLATIERDVRSELDRVSRTLTNRIKQLTERYAAPLPALAASVDELTAKVAGHLKRMGFVW